MERVVRDFYHVQVGDTVRRILAGVVAIDMKVTEVDAGENLLHCGAWTFDRDTGLEVDEDLGWSPSQGMTGSFLIAQDEYENYPTPKEKNQHER